MHTVTHNVEGNGLQTDDLRGNGTALCSPNDALFSKTNNLGWKGRCCSVAYTYAATAKQMTVFHTRISHLLPALYARNNKQACKSRVLHSVLYNRSYSKVDYGQFSAVGTHRLRNYNFANFPKFEIIQNCTVTVFYNVLIFVLHEEQLF